MLYFCFYEFLFLIFAVRCPFQVFLDWDSKFVRLECWYWSQPVLPRSLAPLAPSLFWRPASTDWFPCPSTTAWFQLTYGYCADFIPSSLVFPWPVHWSFQAAGFFRYWLIQAVFKVMVFLSRGLALSGDYFAHARLSSAELPLFTFWVSRPRGLMYSCGWWFRGTLDFYSSVVRSFAWVFSIFHIK